MPATARKVTWEEIRKITKNWPRNLKYYGVPRGGQPIAALLNPVDTPEEADVIVDDLIDSGATRDRYIAEYPDKQFRVLFDKRIDKTLAGVWLQFPWETDQDATVEATDLMTRIIQMYDDSNREGLVDTPRRYLKFLDEFLAPPDFNFTTFNSEGMDEMVLVKNIPFYSLCEHHLAPFFGTAHIAYIPNDKIVGISKLPRTLELYARRFQNQERITQQVADHIERELDPLGVAVVLTAEHLCMSMRGVRKPGSKTTTSAMLGVFRDDLNARQEFLQLIK